MDWIKSAAGEYEAKLALEKANRQTIESSGFWRNVLDQVEKDVKCINQQAAWQAKLQDSPIECRTSPYSVDNPEAEIIVVNFPTGYLRLTTAERGTFLITRHCDPGIPIDPERFPPSEIVEVTVKNGTVVLRTENGGDVIWSRVSEYLLSFIVAALSAD
jgi:hypothetical protein